MTRPQYPSGFGHDRGKVIHIGGQPLQQPLLGPSQPGRVVQLVTRIDAELGHDPLIEGGPLDVMGDRIVCQRVPGCGPAAVVGRQPVGDRVTDPVHLISGHEQLDPWPPFMIDRSGGVVTKNFGSLTEQACRVRDVNQRRHQSV